MGWKATGQPTVRRQRDKWTVRVDGTDAERCALGAFLAGYRGLTQGRVCRRSSAGNYRERSQNDAVPACPSRSERRVGVLPACGVPVATTRHDNARVRGDARDVTAATRMRGIHRTARDDQRALGR